MFIELKNINKTYSLGKVKIRALSNVNLRIEEGHFICLIGKSGSGKTSLLNILGLLDKPDDGGEVIYDGENVLNLKTQKHFKIRNEKIGFVFQSFNLIPVLNVYENVELPLLVNKRKFSNKQKKERIEYFIEEVGLKEYIKHKPDELSAGQRQRVAIARALVTNPEIILADEPTANLDSNTGNTIIELMKKINQIENTTFIIATHDQDILNFADKIYKISDGVIKEH